MKKYLFTLGFLFFLIHPAHSAKNYPTKENDPLFYQPMSFHSYTMEQGSRHSDFFIIYAVGKIEKNTPKKFKSFLDKMCANKNCINIEKIYDTILLHSPGGHLLGAMEFGKILRNNNFITIVDRPNFLTKKLENIGSYKGSSFCESACAYAFLGGINRRLEYFRIHDGESWNKEGHVGKIGLHQFFQGKENSAALDGFYNLSDYKNQIPSNFKTDTEIHQYLSGLIVDYVVKMGVDPRVFQIASRQTRPSMAYPDKSTLQELNFITKEHFVKWGSGQGVVPGRFYARSNNIDPNAFVQQLEIFCKPYNFKKYFEIIFNGELIPEKSKKIKAWEANGLVITFNDNKVFIPEKEISSVMNDSNTISIVPIDDDIWHDFIKNPSGTITIQPINKKNETFKRLGIVRAFFDRQAMSVVKMPIKMCNPKTMEMIR